MIDVMKFKPQLVGEGDVEVFLYNNEAVAIEPKIDGIRILLEKKNGSIRLITRNGKDYTKKYSTIIEHLKQGIITDNILLDGELTVMKDKIIAGAHRAIAKQLNNDETLVYFAFDILEVEGNNLLEADFVTRKQHLNLFVRENMQLRLIPYTFTNTIVDVENFYKAFISKGFEGIVIKNLERYRSCSRFNWLKLKPIRTLDVKIIDKKPTKANKAWVYTYLTEKKRKGTVMSSSDYPLNAIIELAFNKGNFEKLRFPRIVRLREDKIIK